MRLPATALRLLALVALVTLAGCSGALSDESAPDRDTYGVDDELEPSLASDESIQNATQLLPGLTTDGIEEPESLFEAHDEAIGDRTYAMRVELSVENANGTVGHTTVQTLVADPESEIAFRTVERRSDWGNESRFPYVRSSNETVETWYDGGEQLSRTELENETVEYDVSIFEPVPNYGVDGVQRIFMNPLIRQLEYVSSTFEKSEQTVAATNASDGRYYVVRGAVTSDDESDRAFGIESFSAAVAIRDDGFVRQSALEETVVDRGERFVVTQTITVTDVGETTVERPEWYDEALEATDADPRDDQSVR